MHVPVHFPFHSRCRVLHALSRSLLFMLNTPSHSFHGTQRSILGARGGDHTLALGPVRALSGLCTFGQLVPFSGAWCLSKMTSEDRTGLPPWVAKFQIECMWEGL